uniref:Uncharacterized protein n=1 Tax=viral metagenome TaxID=1070528 RepID=A0A6C0H2R7_9ZZZZ
MQTECIPDKQTLMRAFNTHFFDFINDIVSIFPENDDLVYAKNSFETIKKANPTAILKSWYNFVYTPYKDVIEQGNISFFFDKDYRTDLNHIHNSGEIMKMIDKIREPIKNMGDSNKAHSTKYIQNLSKLSLLYNDACAM